MQIKPKPKYKVGDKVEYINNNGDTDQLIICKRCFDKIKQEWYYFYYTLDITSFYYKSVYESKIIRKINDTKK